tara:strand:- start:1463 stop:2671 length:1209 start_codon:yes stop_codon:yes gene_type:complete
VRENNDKKHTQSSLSTTKNIQKRRILLLVLGGIFLLIGLLGFLYWFIWAQYTAYTDDAYVKGNQVPLMSQVAGQVIEVTVEDTQYVKAGQLIARLDDKNYQIALQKAEANLAQTIRQVSGYYAAAASAQENIILTKANLVEAQLDIKRRQGLEGRRAVSKEEIAHLNTILQATNARYQIAKHQFTQALDRVNDTSLYTHPQVLIAQAQLKQAYLNVQRTKIIAPVSGFIARKNIQLGQQVAVNTPLLAIIPLYDVWIDANFKESKLEFLRINQPVTISADAYPNKTYHGKVAGLNAGTGEAFALLPPQNATGNWIKIVQRLPVRIMLNTKELRKHPLQLGLSVRVSVDTHIRQGQRMRSQTHQVPLHLITKVYKNELAQVNGLILKIMQANSVNQTFNNTKL